MEGGKKLGSSFTSDLFGSKDSDVDASSSGIFGSIFAPPAKLPGHWALKHLPNGDCQVPLELKRTTTRVGTGRGRFNSSHEGDLGLETIMKHPTAKSIIGAYVFHPNDSFPVMSEEKPVASTINTLAGALHKVFCASFDQERKKMRQACFDYLSLGGAFSRRPVALLYGLNPRSLSLAASSIILPIINAEVFRQMFFSATVPAYYRAAPA